jgi:hypothetical protein
MKGWMGDDGGGREGRLGKHKAAGGVIFPAKKRLNPKLCLMTD